MDFVLDTNILVHFVRSDAHIRQLDAQFSLFSADNAAFISIVSVGEIESLAYQFDWGESKMKRLNYFLNALPHLPIDSRELTAAYADLDAFSQGVHPRFKLPWGTSSRNMGKNDLWIAATSMLLNAKLLTTDNDFKHLSLQFMKSEIIQFTS